NQFVRREVLHFGPIEQDRSLGDLAPLGVQQIGNRFQSRRLAGAIGAEQCDDPAFRHIERNALQNKNNVVVDDLDIVDRKDRLRGGGCCSSRRCCRRHGRSAQRASPRRDGGERECPLLTMTCRRVRCAWASPRWPWNSPSLPIQSMDAPWP